MGDTTYTVDDRETPPDLTVTYRIDVLAIVGQPAPAAAEDWARAFGIPLAEAQNNVAQLPMTVATGLSEEELQEPVDALQLLGARVVVVEEQTGERHEIDLPADAPPLPLDSSVRIPRQAPAGTRARSIVSSDSPHESNMERMAAHQRRIDRRWRETRWLDRALCVLPAIIIFWLLLDYAGMGWDCKDGLMPDGYTCRGGYARSSFGTTYTVLMVSVPAWLLYKKVREWRYEYYQYRIK